MADHPLDRLLTRRDTLGLPDRVIDRYAMRQRGALSAPSTGRRLRNDRQQAAYDKAERDLLARRRNSPGT